MTYNQEPRPTYPPSQSTIAKRIIVGVGIAAVFGVIFFLIFTHT